MGDFFSNFDSDMLNVVISFTIILVGGFILSRLVMKLVRGRVAKKNDSLLAPLVDRWNRPLAFLIPVMLSNAAIPFYQLDDELYRIISKIVLLLLIGLFSYFLIRTVNAIEDIVTIKYNIDAKDNLQARKVRTQVGVLEKVLITVILILGVTAMVMTFENMRALGTSMLASAGVVGIIIGFAAQRTIANIFAGIQIAITQPIRIDDVVVVEGEWGRIEEITLTYVVVKIWDWRRLVLPINYFIDTPFQNWTRTSADIIGTVFLKVDYSLPIDEVRDELERIVDGHELWDGQLVKLQVTESQDKTMEIRALVTAKDSSQAWDLRCDVREKLVSFIQKNYPECLPRMRAEVTDYSDMLHEDHETDESLEKAELLKEQQKDGGDKDSHQDTSGKGGKNQGGSFNQDGEDGND